MEFEAGDIVRLKKGKSPLIVTRPTVTGRQLGYCYMSEHSGGYFSKHSLNDLPDYDLRKSNKYLEYNSEKFRDINDFELFDWDSCLEKHDRLRYYADQIKLRMGRKPMAPKLYQTKEEKPRFGTLLTTNSKGQFVLEMKGKDGEVEPFDKDMIEEVMPYTVQLAMVGSSCHMEWPCAAEVGEVFLDPTTGVFAKVVGADTKTRNSKPFCENFVRLQTTPVVDGK
jgi:hypothetical protein